MDPFSELPVSRNNVELGLSKGRIVDDDTLPVASMKVVLVTNFPQPWKAGSRVWNNVCVLLTILAGTFSFAFPVTLFTLAL